MNNAIKRLTKHHTFAITN